MRVLLVLPLLAVCATAFYYEPKTADKEFLLKQKKIWNLLFHVSQPEISHEVYEVGVGYSIEANIENYEDEAHAKDFLEYKAQGFLPRHALFSVYYQPLIREAFYLTRLFRYAKDFETFYKTACWARIHMNEGLFCCALYNAVLRREDTKYIQLPPPYEMYPYVFYNSEVIEKAHHAKIFGKFDAKKTHDKFDAHIIPANYSSWYLQRDYDEEAKINYFTEDIGLNAYYFFLRLDTPFWLPREAYNMQSYRGEEYLYNHKQLMNRYYLERLSNDLLKVEDFDWNRKFYPGYYPTMTFHNGLPLPQRPQWTHFPYYKMKYIKDIQEMETRILAAIDSGFAMDATGKLVNIYTPEGLNLLGNMIEGNVDSCNIEFYGSIDAFGRKILGFSLEPVSKHQISPSALEYWGMSCRDPAFYRLYKRIVGYYERYKMHQEEYKKDDVIFDGLKIESFNVDKLITYFDQYDSSIGNGLIVQNQKEAESTVVKVRQYRLNHKPFSFHFSVNSDKKVRAAVRIFFGPKYDAYKKYVDLDRALKYFYEVDSFIVDLVPGSNKIVRNSQDCFFAMPDPEPTELFYKRMTKALETGENFTYFQRVFGFPERLLLPKGKKEGFPLRLFVHVAPVEKTMDYSSRVFGEYKYDGRPIGYPLDRPIRNFFTYEASNMMLKDILIFHKEEVDMHIAA